MESLSIKASAQLRRFALAVAILTLGFAIPLWKLFRFAASDELFSYILLIPFVSLYLLWLKRAHLPLSPRPARPLGIAFLLAGSAILAAYWLCFSNRLQTFNDDYLTVMIICFLLFFYGISSLFWGWETLRAAAFPLAFLMLLAPVPPSLVQEVDLILQRGSAMVAAGFFSLSGTPFLQDGLTFQLSDIKLKIAPECSGIHSTIILLISALLSAHIFLRTLWKRTALVLFVVPIGLLRNGFRVFVIGQLCIHAGPQMIASPLHRKGGPIFFVLSLIPFFLMLFVLHRSEKRRSGETTNIEGQPCAN